MNRSEQRITIQLLVLVGIFGLLAFVCVACSCRSRYNPPPLNGTPEWQPSRHQWPQADGPDFDPCPTEFPKLTE